jgi:2-desacetyl-2-hydroxyethyl bacteriochlorophyllide A dehydrogenase
MKQTAIFFSRPEKIELRETVLPMPGPGQILVNTLFSAISPGTELMIYRGLAPDDLSVDETIHGLKGKFAFPLKYGYSAVGVVAAVGKGISPEWEGRTVFSFHPHESCFLSGLQEIQQIPQGIAPEAALFFPAMETAVNLLMDGHPMIGERVIVFGQGIIGLLTTALLARYPISRLLAIDRFPLRRQYSQKLGAHVCLDPDARDAILEFLSCNAGRDGNYKADLIYELSGNPAALDEAITLAGFHARIVIGSWYGTIPASLHLGSRFHRDRIKLISSQVSTIDPSLRGQWDKQRRADLVWKMIKLVNPLELITHRFPLVKASEAYDLLDQSPEESIQIIFTYPMA